jgi:prophage maintenance system killer protein/Zn-finger nucleic acid-binding protein
MQHRFFVFNPESWLMNPDHDLQIYQAENGALEVQFDPQQDTVWLRQEQLSKLFGRERSVITKHLRHVFDEEELTRDSVCANFAHTAADGKTYQVEHYNLDVIISVGYRVKSKEATRFRQWATRTLREHLTQGFTTHQQRLRDNAKAFEAALALVRQAATQGSELSSDMGRGLVDVVTRYAQSFLWLQQYDEGLLQDPTQQPGGTLPSVDEVRKSLDGLKTRLMARGEATELFARERGEGLAALLGNLDQTVFGEPAYPSIEAKAAHLLYFVIKNHPFVDGNKRSGAFLFVEFLNRNHRLLDAEGQPVVNEMGLAALALLLAESAAEHKETMIKLVMTMLASAPSSAPQEPNQP